MLLAANGESWTSAVAKFISLQGDSMVAPSITNVDAKPAVQTTGPAYSPPVASVHNTSSAGAPDVIPSLALAQTQQQHSSLSSRPLLVNIRDSKLTFAPNSAAVPSSAQQDQSIGQGPTHSQQQQQQQQQEATTMPEASTMPANVKGEQSTNGASLAHLQSMQGESNSGLSAIQRNRESQSPELPDASNSSSVPTTTTTTTTTGLNALHKSLTVCYTSYIYIYIYMSFHVCIFVSRNQNCEDQTTRSIPCNNFWNWSCFVFLGHLHRVATCKEKLFGTIFWYETKTKEVCSFFSTHLVLHAKIEFQIVFFPGYLTKLVKLAVCVPKCPIIFNLWHVDGCFLQGTYNDNNNPEFLKIVSGWFSTSWWPSSSIESSTDWRCCNSGLNQNKPTQQQPKHESTASGGEGCCHCHHWEGCWEVPRGVSRETGCQWWRSRISFPHGNGHSCCHCCEKLRERFCINILVLAPDCIWWVFHTKDSNERVIGPLLS